jgi:hypothetical protein
MIRKKANVLSVGEEFTLSRAEAERRLKIEGYPSLEQIIQRTKAKADWPDERWDEIRRIAAAAEKPDALVVNRKTVFAHIRHCNRWVAAASSLIFVLAVLLIFIPESRAFAIQVYHSVVRLFDNRMEIQQPIQTHTSREYDSQIADNFASELEEEHPQKQEMQMFASLQEFEKATGHIPYRLNASDVAYETSKYQKNRRNEEWLYTYYAYGDGLIVTTQIWNIASGINALTNDSYQLYTTGTGSEVYYSTDKIDGSTCALTQLNDSILMVSADSVVPLERVLQIFK